MTRLEIDRDRCEGHGLCAQSAPAWLDLDDDGEPVVLHEQVTGDMPTELELAVRACPTGSVRVGG